MSQLIDSKVYKRPHLPKLSFLYTYVLLNESCLILCFQLRIEVLFYSLLILSFFFFLSISIHKCMAENSNGYSYTIEYVQQQHQMKNKKNKTGSILLCISTYLAMTNED